MLCIFGLVAPIVWAVYTQQGPTGREQLNSWAETSYAQLTDGKINPNFQAREE